MTETEFSIAIKNQQFENSRLRNIISKQKETIEKQNRDIFALKQKTKELERKVARYTCLGNGFELHHIY